MVILDFESEGGIMAKNPYGDMFCHIFGQLFDVWSYVVRARQNDGEISHFRRAETTSFHPPNRCAPKKPKNNKKSKPFHDQKCKKYVKCVTQQLV